MGDDEKLHHESIDDMHHNLTAINVLTCGDHHS